MGPLPRIHGMVLMLLLLLKKSPKRNKVEANVLRNAGKTH